MLFTLFPGGLIFGGTHIRGPYIRDFTVFWLVIYTSNTYVITQKVGLSYTRNKSTLRDRTETETKIDNKYPTHADSQLLENEYSRCSSSAKYHMEAVSVAQSYR